jgi:hypothetical protein
MCDKPHSSDMMAIISRDSETCYYYLENDISDGEEMEDHTLWDKKVEGFKLGMSLKDDKEALQFLQDCVKLSHKLQSLSGGNPLRKTFIKGLFEL